MSEFNVIDLFSGAGGLSRGFIDAGFKLLLGIDNDEVALKTFEYNHENAKGMNIDLSKPGFVDEIKKHIGNNKVDIIVAGPPCQGFSLTGPRDINDERNQLYLAVIEAIKILKPAAFIIENVPGMATLYKGKVKDAILYNLRKLGYNVDCSIMLAADYGVPQMRKRLIFMGIREDIGEPEFPEPILSEEDYVTCRQAINDLPPRVNEIGKDVDDYSGPPRSEYQKIMRNGCKKLYNHVGTNHTKLVQDTIALVPEGGNHKDLPPGWGESRRFNEAWTRYDGNKPSKTIDTGHRNHFHYEYNRVPTVRENARLQSFTDDFRFCGNKTQQYRQVGNAVPPLLGYHLAKEIKKVLLNDGQN